MQASSFEETSKRSGDACETRRRDDWLIITSRVGGAGARQRIEIWTTVVKTDSPGGFGGVSEGRRDPLSLP